jgi:hypothetical protein
MSSWEETVRRHRPSLLAGVMGLVLLASVGAAAWLAELRAGAVRRGQDIIQHIRGRKLSAFWGTEDQTLWYLIRGEGSRPVGWRMARRMPTADGYIGTSVERDGVGFYQSAWKLDNQGRAGQYVGRISALTERQGLPLPAVQQLLSTSITLRGAEVDVRQQGRRRGEATARTPANYVPEGLTELACFLAAAGGREVSFAMILDEQAVAARRVQFARAEATPEDARRVRVVFRSMVGESQETIHFDQAGRVVRMDRPDSGTRIELSSYQAVVEAFPEAERLAGDKTEGL